MAASPLRVTYVTEARPRMYISLMARRKTWHTSIPFLLSLTRIYISRAAIAQQYRAVHGQTYKRNTDRTTKWPLLVIFIRPKNPSHLLYLRCERIVKSQDRILYLTKPISDNCSIVRDNAHLLWRMSPVLMRGTKLNGYHLCNIACVMNKVASLISALFRI